MSAPSSKMRILVGERVHLDQPLPGGVGDAVEIAADRDHAFVRDPALQFEHRSERQRRQLLQLRLLLGEGFGHHPVGRGVSRGYCPCLNA